MFSAFYLPLLLILVGLIIRGVAFEYRGKRASAAWRRSWDTAIFVGSLLPAILWGVAFGNVLHGIPLNAAHNYAGNFFSMLNPYSLLGGLATLTLFVLDAPSPGPEDHGGPAPGGDDAARLSGVAAVVVGGGFLAWTEFSYRTPGHVATGVASVTLAAAAVVALLTALAAATGWGPRAGGRAPRGPGLRRRRGRHRGRHRSAVHRLVPERAAVHHQHRLHPDYRQRLLDGEDPDGDDRRRLHLPAVRPALPGLDLLGVPQAPGRAPAAPPDTSRSRRRHLRRSHRRHLGRSSRRRQLDEPLDPRLLEHARRARLPVAAVAGLGAAAAGLIIVQAQLLANAIAAAFGGGATLSALRGILLALAVVVVGRAAVAWAGEIASYRASAAVKAVLRRSFLARAVELGPRWLAGRRSAELSALATEGIEALDGYFSKYLPQLILAAIVPVAVLVRVGLADLVAGLTIAATLPLVPVFGALVGKMTGAYASSDGARSPCSSTTSSTWYPGCRR